MTTRVLLMSDVVGSTRAWDREPDAMGRAMARHHLLVHASVAAAGGWRPVDQGEGDAVFAAFDSAFAAVTCAADLQRALAREKWPTSTPLMVRVGLHLGETTERDGNLFGSAVNRCARLRGLAGPGQVLMSAAVHEAVRDALRDGLAAVDLGEHVLKDLSRPERVWQLSGAGLDGPFPALSSSTAVRHNLPAQLSSFIGRQHAVEDLVAALREHRLVTVTGPGGMGKTRLATQAAAGALADESFGDLWFVDLFDVVDPSVVPARLAELLGVTFGEGDPGEALIAHLQERPLVLLLDNLEQVLGCAPFLAELLGAAPHLRILATSREPLRIRGERQYALAPLQLPTGGTSPDLLSTNEAVALFVDRAQAVHPGFLLDDTTASAVAAVCVRLDGQPLALELAASRLKVLSVNQLLSRLDSALTVLTGGPRDLPVRHQTLRATIAWSFDTLSEPEQRLLIRLSALPGAASLELVEGVCGDGLDVPDSLVDLVDKSLVVRSDLDGEPRYGLLVSIRQYAAEFLDAAALNDLQGRHADHIHQQLASFDFYDPEQQKQEYRYVRQELAHIRAALQWLRMHGPAGAFAATVAQLDDTLLHQGLVAETLELCQAALETTADPDVRCDLLIIQSMLSSGSSSELLQDLVSAARQCRGQLRRLNGLVMALYLCRTKAEVEQLLSLVDDELTTIPPGPGHRMQDIERHSAAATLLRFADPRAAEQAAQSGPPDRTSASLGLLYLDRGAWGDALTQFTRALEAWLPLGSYPLLEARLVGFRALALCGSGALQEGLEVAQQAFDIELSHGAVPVKAGLALMAAERLNGNPTRALAAAESAVGPVAHKPPPHVAINADEDWRVVGVRWRRAICLIEVGRRAEAAIELDLCQDFLAASELYGPLELLGVLAGRALLLADEDPPAARNLIDRIEAQRGRWVLPFGLDADLANLAERLSVPPG